MSNQPNHLAIANYICFIHDAGSITVINIDSPDNSNLLNLMCHISGNVTTGGSSLLRHLLPFLDSRYITTNRLIFINDKMEQVPPTPPITTDHVIITEIDEDSRDGEDLEKEEDSLCRQ